MGLDMYLDRHTYTRSYGHDKPEEKIEIIVNKGGKKHEHIKPKRIKYIIEEVGYWRKANQIHKWFVENVQHGEDDCEEYDVSREQLLDLLTLCKRVNDDHYLAKELLPVQSGFFFGDTEYSSYYFDDIKNTIEILEEATKEGGDGWLTYRASW